jgi:hypothetical protein
VQTLQFEYDESLTEKILLLPRTGQTRVSDQKKIRCISVTRIHLLRHLGYVDGTAAGRRTMIYNESIVRIEIFARRIQRKRSIQNRSQRVATARSIFGIGVNARIHVDHSNAASMNDADDVNQQRVVVRTRDNQPFRLAEILQARDSVSLLRVVDSKNAPIQTCN